MKHLLVLTLLLLPTVVFGQSVSREFVPLVGIPGLTDSNDFGGYVNALYILAISIAAFLAVVRIIFAGVKYMMSDVVTDKGEAKRDIRGALVGLLIVLAAVLILNTINPQLTNLDVFDVPADQRVGQFEGDVFSLVFPSGSLTGTSNITDTNGNVVGQQTSFLRDDPNAAAGIQAARDACEGQVVEYIDRNLLAEDTTGVRCFTDGIVYSDRLTQGRTWCMNQLGGQYVAIGTCQVATESEITTGTNIDPQLCTGSGGSSSGVDGKCRMSGSECSAIPNTVYDYQDTNGGTSEGVCLVVL